jgi:hypothetical protein
MTLIMFPRLKDDVRTITIIKLKVICNCTTRVEDGCNFVLKAEKILVIAL